MAPFSRLVRIDASGVDDDSIRVRLSTLADGWGIDAVEVDWAQAAPLEAHPLPMRSAVHGDEGSVLARLHDADASYAVILPGERIDMSFDSYRAHGNGNIAYALEVSGYLHEWPPESEAVNPAAYFPGAPDSDRLTVVDYLVRHREAFLPLVYKYWEQRRQRVAG